MAYRKAMTATEKTDGKENTTMKENMDTLCSILEEEIFKSDAAEADKKAMLKRLRRLCSTETNIMIVGATGCGKSSTINALFACSQEDAPGKSEYVEVAKVGSRTDPETKDIEKYRIGNLILWDTPGLGDGSEIDRHHKDVIRELLEEEDEEGNLLIDLVLLIMDGSTRDLGTSYEILHDVIIPMLGEETGRILIALNQADVAMKTGRHWNYEKNEPDRILTEFLEEKVESIRKRVREDSGLEVSPVYYCAGYEEENGDTVHPYNLSKLLYYILDALPAEKRAAVFEGINTDAKNYEYNDSEMDYSQGVTESFGSMADYVAEGINNGAVAGFCVLGAPGAAVGIVAGAFIGGIKGILSRIFG